MDVYQRIKGKILKREEVIPTARRVYFGNNNVSSEAEATQVQDGVKKKQAVTEDTEKNVAATFSKSEKVQPTPLKDPRTKKLNCNAVKTSRYTIANFLPKFLFQQFGRVANFYYLCIVIIQCVVDSPVSPYTAAIPLLIVLSITGCKQAYEDWRLHVADRMVNRSPVQVLEKEQFRDIKTKDIAAGDIVQLKSEDQVPADLLLLGSSDEFLRCMINTANLDGETTPKIRYIPPGLPKLTNPADLSKFYGIVTCEPPNPSLYEFHGFLQISKAFENSPVDSPSGLSVNNGVNSKEPPTAASALLSSAEAPSKDNGSDPGSGQKIQEFDLGLTDDSSGGAQENLFKIPLSMENIVLRGTTIKQTDFIFGLVVYAGVETRLWENSKQRRHKRSSVEKRGNSLVYVLIIAIAILVTFCTVLHYIYEPTRRKLRKGSGSINGGFVPYPPLDSAADWANDLKEVFLGFVILFQILIPISLYTTVEFQKLIGSRFFINDQDMTCPITGQRPICNTSDLNEELGQIQYLFTDKTGTLTENTMSFRHCSVGSRSFDFRDEELYEQDIEEFQDKNNFPVKVEEDAKIVEFLKILSLCHSVQSVANPQGSKVEGEWEYQSSSPDEKALLEACSTLGVTYESECNGVVTIDMFGQEIAFRRHFLLEFDAERKCMSVIVEEPSGELWLYCKGAETAVLPRCDDGEREETAKAVLEFATLGMRTLVVAKRRLTRSELEIFSGKLLKVKSALSSRLEMVREIYQTLERNMTCVGATGVEDLIQDGVLDLLKSLNKAGIHIWMVTGDKLETGMMVAVDAGLVSPIHTPHILQTDQTKVRAQLERIRRKCMEGEDAVLVIDGVALEAALLECPELLADVALDVSTVVCCRMSPLQKARIVQMVKRSKGGPITAAVGDGGNDVAMIQEAHIGFGIMGKEGRQAAQSADFALARTAYLKKAILVHGHWNYVRLVILMEYIFYKSIVLVLPQFFYTFCNAFSTQTLHHSWAILGYGSCYTVLPIVMYGLFEQPYSAKGLLQYPILYYLLKGNKLMTLHQCLKWSQIAVWHGFVCFFVPYVFWPLFSPVNDWASFGFVVYACIIGVVNMKLLLETRYITWFTVGGYFFSYGSMILLFGIYCETDILGLSPGDYRNVYSTSMANPLTWVVILGTHAFALLPEVVYKLYTNSGSSFKALFRPRHNLVQPSNLSLEAESSLTLVESTVLSNESLAR